MSTRWLAGIAMASALACGSTGPSANVTFVGTIRGMAFSPQDQGSSPAVVSVGGVSVNAGAVALLSRPNLCGYATANQEPMNTQFFVLFMTDVNLLAASSSPPSAPGTYTVFTGGGIPPAKAAAVRFFATDATCAMIVAQGAEGISGTVTLTSVSNGVYAGSFDLTMQGTDALGNPVGPTDHVTGTFDPPNCAALGTAINSPNPTCV
jgi:hypothetical protein